MTDKIYTDEMVDDLIDFWHTEDHLVGGALVALDDAARSFLDAVAPAIAARALREVAADLRDGAERNPFTEGGRRGIRIAADVCEERATALADVTA